MDENAKELVDYIGGFFSCPIEDRVIKTAITQRCGDIPLISEIDKREFDLIVADILMVFYRSPKGVSKTIKSGDFTLTLGTSDVSIENGLVAYQQAQEIYRMYDDAKLDKVGLNVINI